MKLGVKDQVIVEPLGDGLNKPGVFEVQGEASDFKDNLQDGFNALISQLVDVERPGCGASASGDTKARVSGFDKWVVVEFHFQIRHPGGQAFADVNLVQGQNG